MLTESTSVVSCDIETNGLYAWAKGARTNSIGFGVKGWNYIIPCTDDDWVEFCLYEIMEWLEGKTTVMHNGRFDVSWIWHHYEVRLPCDFDTMIAHYVLDENSRHNLKTSRKAGPGIAQRLCGAPDWDIDTRTKKGKGNLSQLYGYQAYDLHYTRELYFKLSKMLDAEPSAKKVFYEILCPVADIFTEASFDGIVVNEEKFDEAEAYLRGEIEKCEKELNKFAKINWRSTKELGDLLYNKFKLPVKTPQGKPSTSESALNQLDHPCVSALIKLRGANQQLSFFIEGWKPWIHRTKRATYLHPSFKLHGTVTGRPSCEMPNLFQVPRDKRIRSLITAEKGWTFIEADLSQIEMRLAAHVSGDPNLLYAFTHDIDVHWSTALREIERGHGLVDLVMSTARALQPKRNSTSSYAEAIQIMLEAGPDKCADINDEWKEYRKKAKAVNFGYLYGMWWKKFKTYARDNYGVEVTDEQAEASRKYYFKNYPALAPWHERQKRFAQRNGYVVSLAGRRRRLPDAMNENDEFRQSQALRQSINSPIQSFANDINFMSAIQLRQEYGRDKVRICGTVYDAILARVKDPYVDEVVGRLLEIMSCPPLFKKFGIELDVPIEAEAKIGPWGAGIEYHRWREQR
jgi:DNA polymerase-1